MTRPQSLPDRNLARTAQRYTPHSRSPSLFYTSSDPWENLHYIRPRFPRPRPESYFKRPALFRRDTFRRLRGSRIARQCRAAYTGRYMLGVSYLWPIKVLHLRHRVRMLNHRTGSQSEFVELG